MPIDASIALGVQPVKLDNPMNQLAQMMQIEASQKQNRLADLQMQQHQQTFDESNKLRDYWAKNDPSSPNFVPGMMAISPTQGMAYQKSALEGKKLQGEVSAQDFKLAKDNHAIVQQELGAAAYDPSLSRDGAIAVAQGLVQRGAMRPDMFESFTSSLPQDAAGIKARLLQSVYSQLSAEQLMKAFAPDTKWTDNGQVKTPYESNPNAPGFKAPQPVPMLPTPGEVLREKSAAAGRAQSERHFNERKTEASTAAGKPPSGYRYLPNGDLEPITGGPADQKAQATAGLKAAGVADVDSAIAVLRDAYDRLDAGGGITNTENGALGNVASSISSSGVGQVVGRALGTNNQSARNDIAMTRPALLAALMKATGMSAKQMDSNAELKLWMATATDPTLDVGSNRRALANIERKYMGAGGSAPAAPTASPQDAQAMEWAKANPSDPRSKAIMERLKGK